MATVGTIKRALTEYYDTQIPNREVNRLLTLGLGHEPNEGEVHEDDTHVFLASFMNGVRTTIIPRYSLKEEVSERQQRDDFLREVSPAEKAAIAACFEEVDESGDGELDIDELEELLTKIYGMEPSKVQVQQLMLAIDLDGDGAVDLEEFISAMATVKEVQDASAIFQWRQLFERYDQDESGELGRAELMVMAEEMWARAHQRRRLRGAAGAGGRRWRRAGQPAGVPRDDEADPIGHFKPGSSCEQRHAGPGRPDARVVVP